MNTSVIIYLITTFGLLLLRVLAVAAIAVILIIVVSKALKKENEKSTEERKQKETGEPVEKGPSVLSIMRSDDTLFSDVKIVYDGQPMILDKVIVNKGGLFIFEVKTYSGKIFGNADADEWMKLADDKPGKTTGAVIKNPIPKIKNRANTLAKYLEENGVNAFVKGYAYFVQKNAPFENELFLSDLAGLDAAIHAESCAPLTDEAIEKIKELLKK